MAYAQLDARLGRLPFDPGEIWLVSLTAMLLCELDYAQSMAFIVNFGRDNDTAAAVAGTILGALHGAKGLPQAELTRLLDQNRPLGQDLEYQAARMVETLRPQMIP
ncbi:MAG: ADP-ribosylglycohydrolase family protein [Bacteroidetes bacterium]|nr:MAG: ADP-ribosylglycohydrolase family protein [Bacteroidota bacterium]